MKKILILGLLLGVWLSQVEAGCKRSDIANLKHKGFSVAEISRICGISYNQKQAKTKKHHRRSSGGGRWMNLTEDECDRLAGDAPKAFSHGCAANDYARAKRICRRAGGRIPTLNDFRRLGYKCGIDVYTKQHTYRTEKEASCLRSLYIGSGYYWFRPHGTVSFHWRTISNNKRVGASRPVKCIR